MCCVRDDALKDDGNLFAKRVELKKKDVTSV